MKYLIFIHLLLASLKLQASICSSDRRVRSQEERVARMRSSLKTQQNCTATLVGRNCLITAGHCKASDSWLVEFDVPLSNEKNGDFVNSSKENIFYLDKVIDFENSYIGKDWMVFTVKRNRVSNLFPGDERGYYRVSNSLPFYLGEVLISAYGPDSDNTLNGSQQMAIGEIINTNTVKKIIEHTADTQVGNSGASLIETYSNEIVGVHSHGGCRRLSETQWEGNKATLVYENKKLLNALKSCLK